MRLCRFKTGNSDEVRVGLINNNLEVRDLTPAGITQLGPLLESGITRFETREALPRLPFSAVQFCAPVEQQEIWAAGVTYLRSKTARMEESNFSATAYDKVYAAERPELFFKSMPDKVVGPGDAVGIRRDARWNVPEPELALVLNSKGRVVGCTIGNDMSARDIEGENLLYLPQAKIYSRSCALGPWIELGADEAAVRQWTVRLAIRRNSSAVFQAETPLGRMKRSFAELAGFLFRSQDFPHGAVLLTGTGIVPPDSFNLQAGDEIEIEISGIGTLQNTVTEV